jgi:hypothetical protein
MRALLAAVACPLATVALAAGGVEGPGVGAAAVTAGGSRPAAAEQRHAALSHVSVRRSGGLSPAAGAEITDRGDLARVDATLPDRLPESFERYGGPADSHLYRIGVQTESGEARRWAFSEATMPEELRSFVAALDPYLHAAPRLPGTVRVVDGVAQPRLTCPGRIGVCRGVGVLRIAGIDRTPRRSFRVAAGRSTRLRLPLDRRTCRELSRGGRLVMRLLVTSSGVPWIRRVEARFAGTSSCSDALP